jgi:hypothetical protein
LIFAIANLENVHIRCRYLYLLTGEEIDGDQRGLGVTVLVSLGGGDFPRDYWYWEVGRSRRVKRDGGIRQRTSDKAGRDGRNEREFAEHIDFVFDRLSTE